MARSEQFIIPITSLFLVSAGSPTSDITLPINTRGLLVGNQGVLNVTIRGVEYDLVPFIAGITPGFFETVRSGGSASNIWAVT